MQRRSVKTVRVYDNNSFLAIDSRDLSNSNSLSLFCNFYLLFYSTIAISAFYYFVDSIYWVLLSFLIINFYYGGGSDYNNTVA